MSFTHLNRCQIGGVVTYSESNSSNISIGGIQKNGGHMIGLKLLAESTFKDHTPNQAKGFDHVRLRAHS